MHVPTLMAKKDADEGLVACAVPAVVRHAIFAYKLSLEGLVEAEEAGTLMACINNDPDVAWGRAITRKEKQYLEGTSTGRFLIWLFGREDGYRQQLFERYKNFNDALHGRYPINVAADHLLAQWILLGKAEIEPGRRIQKTEDIALLEGHRKGSLKTLYQRIYSRSYLDKDTSQAASNYKGLIEKTAEYPEIRQRLGEVKLNIISPPQQAREDGLFAAYDDMEAFMRRQWKPEYGPKCPVTVQKDLGYEMKIRPGGEEPVGSIHQRMSLEIATLRKALPPHMDLFVQVNVRAQSADIKDRILRLVYTGDENQKTAMRHSKQFMRAYLALANETFSKPR